MSFFPSRDCPFITRSSCTPVYTYTHSIHQNRTTYFSHLITLNSRVTIKDHQGLWPASIIPTCLWTIFDKKKKKQKQKNKKQKNQTQRHLVRSAADSPNQLAHTATDLGIPECSLSVLSFPNSQSIWAWLGGPLACRFC